MVLAALLHTHSTQSGGDLRHTPHDLCTDQVDTVQRYKPTPGRETGTISSLQIISPAV